MTDPHCCLSRYVRIVRIVLRAGIGVLFICAAWEKLLNPAAFVTAIANYDLLPELFLHPVALTLPPLELLCGLMLILGRWPAATAWLILLAGAFLVAQAQALARGLHIQCGCFGAEVDSSLTIGKLLANTVLLTALIYLLRSQWRSSRESAHRVI